MLNIRECSEYSLHSHTCNGNPITSRRNELQPKVSFIKTDVHSEFPEASPDSRIYQHPTTEKYIVSSFITAIRKHCWFPVTYVEKHY